MSWITTWAITVDGKSATSAFNPWLDSISLSEREHGGGDSASLVLDDTDGQCFLPRTGALVTISLGGVKKFTGFTEVPHCDYGRGSGRTITVHCVSHDSRGRVKEAQHWHQDGGSLGDFLNRAAKQAGVSITVDPSFASITRDWWSPGGASLLHLGTRLAEELGGTFKMKGGQAILAARGTGVSPSGVTLPSVTFDCAAGDVIRISGRPLVGEISRTAAEVHWFDRNAAKWRTERETIEPLPGAPDSIARPRRHRATSGDASRMAKGRHDHVKHHKGDLSVETDLRVTASVGAPAVIVNDRPGIDGTWVIATAHHTLNRHGGGHSSFQLKRPGGTAGTDGRKASSKS